jgi:UDP-N-acetylglucosamine--N-acetylmuramyl-(pentapeptide) pyrophosphoryl-undecaprenol N-acetylglucosamine transferase
VAIACGGTGGHLFPGLAVAGELKQRGCEPMLLVSPKEVDQQAARSATGLEVATLPAVALERGRALAFGWGFCRSFATARRWFRQRPCTAVLGMGGFTSAPPILAGRMEGAATFLHESNTIPGRANRWLARVVDQAFVAFPSAAARLRNANVVTTGTPVRPQFKPAPAGNCRLALGLDAAAPVLLILGGSQGASGINELVLGALPVLRSNAPSLQFLHLTGPRDLERVQTAYAAAGARALVRSFLTEMELAMGAATLAVSRAGGSSLAELAAMRVPALLIPYPAAADDHQRHNARALADAGAAALLEPRGATAESLGAQVLRLLRDETGCERMRAELVRWHAPRAAADIAERMVTRLQRLGQWPQNEEASMRLPSSAPGAAPPEPSQAIAV